MSLHKSLERLGKEVDKYEDKVNSCGKKSEDKKVKLTEIFDLLTESYDQLTDAINKIEEFNVKYGKKKKVSSDNSSGDEKVKTDDKPLVEATESKECDIETCKH